MEGFLMENGPVSVRKYSSFGAVNYNSSSYGGLGFTNNKSTTQYNYSQIHPPPSVNQLLLDTNYSSATRSLIRGGSLFSSAPPPPPPLYSSFPLHRPHRHQQPPLLPLPLKSASLPAPKALAKTKNQRRKTKRSQQQPKPAETVSTKPVEKIVKMAKETDQEEETEEEFLIGSPSSVLSPPPSSLPLPRLLLIKLRSSAKGAAGSCTAEAKAGAATDDLRKLLRL